VLDVGTAESSEVSWGKRLEPDALVGPIAWQPVP
jgi:hypothetical protein